MAALDNRAVSAIHQVWPSGCILMSAESNDTAPLHSARTRKIPTVVKDYNQIKFASNAIVWSDVIVTGMIQTDEVLTIPYKELCYNVTYSQASHFIYTV